MPKMAKIFKKNSFHLAQAVKKMWTIEYSLKISLQTEKMYSFEMNRIDCDENALKFRKLSLNTEIDRYISMWIYANGTK